MTDDQFSFDKKTLGWLLVAILGGNIGVVTLNRVSPDMRADAFTATEAKKMQAEITAIHAIQQTMLFRMAQREQQDKEMLNRIRTLERVK